jgi:hypothetical protein
MPKELWEKQLEQEYEAQVMEINETAPWHGFLYLKFIHQEDRFYRNVQKTLGTEAAIKALELHLRKKNT